MAWTEYQTRIRLPAYLERDRTTVLTMPMYSAGALAAPSSGTVTIYDASNAAVVSAAAVTITASIATYSLLAATVASSSFGGGWRVEWSLVMADTYTHVERQDAALVRARLSPVVTDLDILARHTDLASFRPTALADWSQYIETAWEDVVARLESAGRRPYLVISPQALRPIHLATTLEIIMRDLSGAGDPQNRWSALAEHYRAEVESAWARTSLVYDEDDDGVASSSRRSSAMTALWLSGKPR